MSYSLKIKHRTRPSTVEAQDMKIGEIGKVTSHLKRGALVLKTFTGLVNLENPEETWSPYPLLTIELLPEGTEIVLTIQEG